MGEKEIKQAVEQIPVPREKVFEAIDRGLRRGHEQKKLSNNRKLLISSVAALLLIGGTVISGFVHPSMNKVLAKAPFIGQLFVNFGDSLGINLANQNMVTELNQALTKNGVTVKMTSAYFDGNVVSITGHVKGELEKGHNEPGEISFDVNFDNNQGDQDPWLDGKSTDVKPNKDGYDFQWVMAYPYKEIRENLTVPISIHSINGIKGEWNFTIPISQKKSTLISFDDEVTTYQEEGAAISVKELNIAQASSSLVYETITTYKEDAIDFVKVIDNKGRVLGIEGGTILSEGYQDNKYHKTLRGTTKKIDKDITTLTFYPQLSIAEPKVEQILNTNSFTLKSKRTDLMLKVNQVKHVGDKLTLDYQLLGLPYSLSKNKIDLVTHNLGYMFTLVDKEYVDEIDKDNPFPPENHSVSRNTVKIIDKKNARFRSEFQLNGEEKIKQFKLENTILQFNFSSLIESRQLSPFTIEINQR